MEKVIVCQCKTSRDCINYVQTGKENDFSCRHYVNPQAIEGVTSNAECINYVTEKEIKDGKPNIVCPCCYEDDDDCDCMDDDFYDEEDLKNEYDKGYLAGYEHGYEDGCLDECDDEEDFHEFDFEEEEEIPEPLRRLVGRVNGRQPEHKNKPIYIAIEKANPMKVLGFDDWFETHVLYSDVKSDIEKEIKNKTDMIAIDFDKWKASYETEDYPIDECFLFHIKFTK